MTYDRERYERTFDNSKRLSILYKIEFSAHFVYKYILYIIYTYRIYCFFDDLHLSIAFHCIHFFLLSNVSYMALRPYNLRRYFLRKMYRRTTFLYLWQFLYKIWDSKKKKFFLFLFVCNYVRLTFALFVQFRLALAATRGIMLSWFKRPRL